ncbi:MAG: pyridoxamine 5'-phosphate oxidase family protein [Gammaproteobacteria bacterium]|nr:pyridoxamine 5'-phosphate oxidase family protein [Gammaproteobacteria bacterium]
MTSSPFHPGEIDAQQRWGNPELWTDARLHQLIWDRIPDQYHARIEAAPFFFLASSAPDGRCDCSFKGGGPGLIKVLAADRLAFPHFEPRVKGNGAYMSLGNILLNPHVSMLFVDFTDGARLRVNGRASIHEDALTTASFPPAECVIVVDVELVMPSCPSYVPHLIPAEPSCGGAK